MPIRHYVEVARRHWILIVAISLIGVVAAAFVALRTPAEYEATSQAYVTTQTAATPSDLSAANAFAAAAVVSYAKLGTTDVVLDPVISSLGLNTTSTALRQQVVVTADQNSVLLTIIADAATPQAAANLANAVGSSLSSAVTTLNPQSANSNSQVKLTVVQRATPPDTTSGPSLLYVLVLGLLGGLIVAVALTAFTEQLNTRVRSVGEVQTLTRAPVLGALRVAREIDRKPLITVAEPDSPLSEEFRDLRNNLRLIGSGRSVRSVVVTSCGESEGKTTVVANLAVALGQTDIRVAVVDGDLRRAGLSRMLGLEDAPGLSEVLRNEASLEEVVVDIADRAFSLIPAGVAVTNPNELLQTASMSSTLALLVSRFDVVLIDCPPMLPVSDAIVLARLVDGVALVTALGEVTRPQLDDARTVFDRVDLPLLGSIVSMVPRRELHGRPDRYKQRYRASSSRRSISSTITAELAETAR